MTAMSIRNMHQTQVRLEESRYDQERAAQRNREKSRYWFIERRLVRRGKVEWIFVRDYIGTKQEAAELWNRVYRHHIVTHRLVHKLSY